MHILKPFSLLGQVDVTVICLPNYLIYRTDPLLRPSKMDACHLFWRTTAKDDSALRHLFRGENYTTFTGSFNHPEHVRDHPRLQKLGINDLMVCHVPCGQRWFAGFLIWNRDRSRLSAENDELAMALCRSVSSDIYHRHGKSASPFYRCGFLTEHRLQILELMTCHGMKIRDIADYFGVSEKNISMSHLHPIRRIFSQLPEANLPGRGRIVRTQAQMVYLAKLYDLA